MNKNFYKASLLGLFLGTGYVANAQSIESKPPGVGIQTQDPKETLDVRGTAKITDLPSNGATSAIYNGQQTKSAGFNAIKTVVADAQGVLGSLPYILPAGTATNTSLKWVPNSNGQGGTWTAVEPATNVDTSLANTDQTITSGEGRNVVVNGTGTSLTFSSEAEGTISHKTISFKKNDETITIMPNTSGKASYIGFHKDQGADYTAYVGHSSADNDLFEINSTSNLLKVGAKNGNVTPHILFDGSGGNDDDIRVRINAGTWGNDSGEIIISRAGNVGIGDIGNIEKNHETGSSTLTPGRFSTRNKLTVWGPTRITNGVLKLDNVNAGTVANDTQILIRDTSGTAENANVVKYITKSSLLPTGTNGQVLTHNGTNWVAGAAPSTGEKSPWFVKNTATPAKDLNKTDDIYHEGAVGIGFNQSQSNTMENSVKALTTSDKKVVKLAVNGAVVAGAFRGAHGANIFPDYVFQKYYTGVSSIKDTYNFNTLSQVESFVKENGHLPGYKSAAEIKEQGYIDLMDTQLTNVEKIEELYLHSIEQDKEIKAKDAKIKELEARLERLEKLLK